MCGPGLSWDIAGGGRWGGLSAPLCSLFLEVPPCPVLGEEELGRCTGNAFNLLLSPSSSSELCLQGES